LSCHRRPRTTLSRFCPNADTYLRGRAEQFRLNPTFGSALNLLRHYVCVYLLALIILELLPLAESTRSSFFRRTDLRFWLWRSSCKRFPDAVGLIGAEVWPAMPLRCQAIYFTALVFARLFTTLHRGRE